MPDESFDEVECLTDTAAACNRKCVHDEGDQLPEEQKVPWHVCHVVLSIVSGSANYAQTWIFQSNEGERCTSKGCMGTHRSWVRQVACVCSISRLH